MNGETVAHYRILKMLGAGGMGMVYRAHDLTLRRDVALKLLLPHTSDDPTARERMMREAQTASSLNHPNICTIYEVGESDGQIFIAMEVVDGGTLGDRIGSSGLPTGTVIEYGIQIADALSHAHDRGVIHRDVKSANVLITGDGRLKVTDFGIAKRDTGSVMELATLTQPGMIAGTPQFLAPELLRGSKADVGSEIWALGVLLYEMASGTLPFRGSTEFEVSNAILNQEPAPLPAHVPSGLAAVILRCLEKDRGARYAAVADVRNALDLLITARWRTAAAAELPPAATPTSAPAAPAAPRPRGRRTLVWGAAAAVALALAGLAAFPAMRKALHSGAGTQKITSLAVLPLQNFSGDPEQQYFADGMTEELITELAQLGVLRVISRTSVMRFRGSTQSLPEIGRALGVDAIVEGSVQRAGDRVRVTAQLVRAAQDEHLWAASYDRDLRDALALQDEVARAIVHEVSLRLTPRQEAALRGAKVVDPEVYRLYLRGRYSLAKRTQPALAAALKDFQDAVARDPDYAPAHAALGEAYGGGAAPNLPRDQVLTLARREIERAVALDPDFAEGRTALGDVKFFADWDWPGAEREYRRALELNPNSVDAHLHYAQFATLMGRPEEGFEHARQARAIDPLSAQTGIALGWHDIQARNYADAAEQFHATLAIDPTYADAYGGLGVALFMEGRLDEAMAEYRKGVALGGAGMDTLDAYALVLAARGQREPALRLAARHAGQPGFAMYLAWMQTLLGNKDAAFEALSHGVESRDEGILELRSQPQLEPLRADPRYAALLRRMKLPV